MSDSTLPTISHEEYQTAMLLMIAEILGQLRLQSLAADGATAISAIAMSAGTTEALQQHAPNFQKMMNQQAVTVVTALGKSLGQEA